MTTDGANVLRSGMTAQGYFTSTGRWVPKEEHDEAKENYEIEIEEYWEMINEKVLDAMYDEAEVSARESSDGGAFFENRDIQGALDDIYSTLTECIDEWDDFNRITNGYRAGADVEIRAALEITISNARSKFIELNGEECADGDASE